ncbi:carbohydrate ABC transporter permease [Cohnella hashimotonis]|uniref:Carbohydrate ABC transporter permease n=1 Tax=Cohnella hashimotonis TaxID=2826895 RepID=A0ABT6TTL0_9BACL|nr:carbohydrate ABC transporter permease [Cohnella hashimotonis]MDI4649122.1 carbohydrate ABC transporter permease [Cohnella hashimotonis]
MNLRKWSISSVVIGVCLILIVATMLYPFLYMTSVSLSKSIYVLRGEVTWLPKALDFSAYKAVLKDPRIGQSYLNTFIYVSLGTLVSLVITALGGYALSRKDMMFHKGWTLIIIFTMFFQGGMIPTFLAVKSLGVMDSVWAMVLPGAVSTWNLLVMRTFFAGFPGELVEAGRIDGLNDFGIFVRIVVPLSKAVFATIGLFYAVGIWNNFTTPLLYLRNPDLFPLQVVLQNIVLAGNTNGESMSVGADSMIVDESLKYATIMVSTIPIMILYPMLQKYFVKGAMIGSVKG